MRTAMAVVAGYLVLAVFLLTAFTLAYMAAGHQFAFQPGSLEVTTGWLLMAVAVNFVAAALGGFICAFIAKERAATAVRALAALIIVLGLAVAFFHLAAPGREAPPKAIAELSSAEAAKFARQPVWFEFLVPLSAPRECSSEGAPGSRKSPEFLPLSSPTVIECRLTRELVDRH